jgi:hypothetical protein
VVTPSSLALAVWGTRGHRSSGCQRISVHFLDSTSCDLRILQLMVSKTNRSFRQLYRASPGFLPGILQVDGSRRKTDVVIAGLKRPFQSNILTSPYGCIRTGTCSGLEADHLTQADLVDLVG